MEATGTKKAQSGEGAKALGQPGAFAFKIFTKIVRNKHYSQLKWVKALKIAVILRT